VGIPSARRRLLWTHTVRGDAYGWFSFSASLNRNTGIPQWFAAESGQHARLVKK